MLSVYWISDIAWMTYGGLILASHRLKSVNDDSRLTECGQEALVRWDEAFRESRKTVADWKDYYRGDNRDSALESR